MRLRNIQSGLVTVIAVFALVMGSCQNAQSQNLEVVGFDVPGNGAAAAKHSCQGDPPQGCEPVAWTLPCCTILS